MNHALFSSEKTDWETPWELYECLDKEFHFTCDAAADDLNHKHDNYYTKKEDGLKQTWEGVCWCNPLYGRDVGKWVLKVHSETK